MSSSPLTYDDRGLQGLFEDLAPKQRVKALRGAFRREANRVRRAAIGNLHESIGGDAELDRGVRAIVFRRKAGFRVTVGTKRANKKGKGERGYYISRKRRGKPYATGKPVLIWAEEGTTWRRTRGRGFLKRRGGHSTGRMKRYGFMRKTLSEVRGSVTGTLHREIINQIKKTAKKNGCS